MRKIWLSIAAVVVLVIATAAYPLPWLVIRDGPQWRFAFPGGEGTTFTLRWMHSVEKEDWEEWFAVTEGDAIEITDPLVVNYNIRTCFKIGKICSQSTLRFKNTQAGLRKD